MGLLEEGTFDTQISLSPTTGNVVVVVVFFATAAATTDAVRDGMVTALMSVATTQRTTTTSTSSLRVDIGGTTPARTQEEETLYIAVGIGVGVAVLIVIIVVAVVLARQKGKQVVNRSGKSHVTTPTARANTYLQAASPTAASPTRYKQ